MVTRCIRIFYFALKCLPQALITVMKLRKQELTDTSTQLCDTVLIGLKLKSRYYGKSNCCQQWGTNGSANLREMCNALFRHPPNLRAASRQLLKASTASTVNQVCGESIGVLVCLNGPTARALQSVALSIVQYRWLSSKLSWMMTAKRGFHDDTQTSVVARPTHPWLNRASQGLEARKPISRLVRSNDILQRRVHLC